jgi:hypothetical protein
MGNTYICEYTQQTNTVNYDEGQTRNIFRVGAPTNRSIIHYIVKNLIGTPGEAANNEEFCILPFR